MSNTIVNVSKNVNNYNSETLSTEMPCEKLFSSEILPPSPSLPSHFFICLEKFKHIRNVMPYQTVVLGRIVEDT